MTATMTEPHALQHIITQEIADLVGEQIDDIGPGKPGEIDFAPRTALPAVVKLACRMCSKAQLDGSDGPAQQRRHRLLRLLLAWVRDNLQTGKETLSAICHVAGVATYTLQNDATVLDNPAITYQELLDLAECAEKPGDSPRTDLAARLREQARPIPQRPVIWSGRGYRLEELTHPTHVLVQGKALRQAFATVYEPTCLDDKLGNPGSADAAPCLEAWLLIERGTVRLFSFGGRRGPLLTLALDTATTTIAAISGRDEQSADPTDTLESALIEALTALATTAEGLRVAPQAVSDGLRARFTRDAPALLAICPDVHPSTADQQDSA